MVTVKVRLHLYEGASCDTQDLDGQTMWHTYVLEPGESVQNEVWNCAEGGDYAWTGFTIYAPKLWSVGPMARRPAILVAARRRVPMVEPGSQRQVRGDAVGAKVAP
jgi:hypothetical protein